MSTDDNKPQVFLEADDEIRGQKYVCLSFLTPNRGLLRRKDLFFFSEFLKFYALDYKIKATEGFLMAQYRAMQNTLSDAVLAICNADTQDVSGARDVAVKALDKMRGDVAQKSAADIEAYVKGNLSDFRESSIVEEYEKWLVVNQQKLEDQFHKENNFQTSVHGLKVRGVYSNHDQAKARAQALSKKDPYFNVYVADVGEWLPWDPNPEDVESSEYQNEELNKLMQAYKENAAKREAWFEQEKREKLASAAAAASANKEVHAAARQARIGVAKPIGFGEKTEEPEREAGEAAKDLASGEDLALARKKEQAAADTIQLA